MKKIQMFFVSMIIIGLTLIGLGILFGGFKTFNIFAS